MIKNFLVPLIVAPLLFVALSASALTYQTLDPSAPGFVYSPIADGIKFYDGNITPQNVINIQAATEEAFGLTSGSLSFVAEAAVQDTSPSTFTSNTAFNYLAIHFGGSELFFYWDNAINSFSIADYKDITGGEDGTGGGISNYRAYTDGLSEVPVPAAAWLFGSALLGLMGLRRRML
ncbi:MAG: VPLPA-CTERM sorting domain-containing protein [Pseudomonadota bacterium]